jgi:hypothetical protein
MAGRWKKEDMPTGIFNRAFLVKEAIKITKELPVVPGQ